MNEVTMQDVEITEKCLAIVMFGPAHLASGSRPAEYYQVTIDPRMVSPSLEYVRFGLYGGDEIQGWQRLAALTLVEVLSPTDKEPIERFGIDNDKIVIRAIVR